MLKKIEKLLNVLSENSVFWGPKLISNYSRQLNIGEYWYLLAKISFDTAEIELLKVLMKWGIEPRSVQA